MHFKSYDIQNLFLSFCQAFFHEVVLNCNIQPDSEYRVYYTLHTLHYTVNIEIDVDHSSISVQRNGCIKPDTMEHCQNLFFCQAETVSPHTCQSHRIHSKMD